ncbi:CmpA/NrtA family ABC transporter substrate-binding protein [Phenylobacterium montanum]|uniref:ABC transporter substrate-binding protein n=1 Tax=Phenylobacterium montanum TaxID=2823693 RepID=A0A975G3J5_9CAUL|nr:CmpA/NrtA family ABC transporter substrate-binding protein [Caulobacter sp. S6]QUD89351.1 ABC transporter substrate-binding protein [Caulobacter sp. S6]
MSRLERREVRLGFIPLNDAAPLIAAREKGFFADEGLEVALSREASWANVRDKVAVGLLDGAHMLGPLPIACSLGLSGPSIAMIAPFSLNLNGSAVTVSRALAEAMRETDPQGMASRPRTARPLKAVIEARRAAGLPLLTFAVVFPFSMHNYELRYWLAEAGVDPDRDVRLVITPPPRMAERLASGEIDGFCVTAPWNAQAVADGTGEIMIYAAEIWRVGPDKVFGLTADWAERHPETLQALLRALLKASAWCDEPANRAELGAILAGEAYLNASPEIVGQSLVGSPPYAQGEPGEASLDYVIYHRYAASFPWRSHAVWFLTQMLRWGQIGPEVDVVRVAEAVYRPDLFRIAAAALGEPAPLVEEKVEGAHAEPWRLDEATTPIRMAPDLFFDGRLFDAAQPERYVRGFEIGRILTNS